MSCHICTLTVFLQSTVYELCSRSEERSEVKLWMVCSFNAMVFHFKVAVELLARVDPVSTRCSIQHVSHTKRQKCGFISRHGPADAYVD